MKFIFNGFILLIFLIFVQRTITNLVFLDKRNVGDGIIYKTDSFDGDGEAPTTYGYYIIDKDQIKYKEDTDIYENFSKGDSVLFRKIFNINFNTVKIINVNGKKVRNYYDLLDYLSPVIVVLIILGYLYIPKLLKK